MVSHHHKFGAQWHCGSGDIMLLVKRKIPDAFA